ncbi:urotensin-2-like [Solea senegalensis]|uniref:Urotensin-2-like n=1 Tax=Solea senegalensis TaxID=28829 RepID=A0AAV6SQV5_SOLSE|nr:urotensin-2-like [Solea senegalensis]KAG7519278.1 urotensin-2-like [Solea senegalensis]
MKCNHLLSWTVLLMASGPLLAHPITDSAEMIYPGAASVEERGVGTLDDLSLSEQGFPPQESAGLRYSSLLSDGVRTTGLFPRGMNREVLLEKQTLLNPLSRAFGIRKQFRKRGGNSECFWKYCV